MSGNRCLICRKVLSGKKRSLPAGRNLVRFCLETGLPLMKLKRIETRRFLCFSHFTDESFDSEGRIVPMPTAKPLSPEDISRILPTIEDRYRQTRASVSNAHPASSTQLHDEETMSIGVACEPMESMGVNHRADVVIDDVFVTTPPLSMSPNSASYVSLPVNELSGSMVLSGPSVPNSRSSTTPSPLNSSSVPNSRSSANASPSNSSSGQRVTSYDFYLVNHQQLFTLFAACPCFRCGQKLTSDISVASKVGTAITLHRYCKYCKLYSRWGSQSYAPGTEVYDGNIAVSVATSTTPICQTAVSEFCAVVNMPYMSKGHHYRIAKSTRKVVHIEYEGQRRALNRQIKDNNPCSVSVDGTYDTRGYCAEWCTVSFMNTLNAKIFHYELENRKNNNRNSPGMEKKCVRQGLQALEAEGIIFASVTSDRSSALKTLMSQEFSHIPHMLDPWHVFSPLKKLFREECKKRRGRKLKLWKNKIINHLYWILENTDPGENRRLEMLASILFHVVGKHTWDHGDAKQAFTTAFTEAGVALPAGLFTKTGRLFAQLSFSTLRRCIPLETNAAHGANQDSMSFAEKSWFLLFEHLTTDLFMADFLSATIDDSTSALEGYHSLLGVKYRSKNYYYAEQGSIMRTELAIIHHNRNIDQEAAGIRVVERVKNSRCKQNDERLMTKTEKTRCSVDWKREFILSVSADLAERS